MAVTGIGGVFFRARDPEALAAWYRTHFGITDPGEAVWQQQAGPRCSCHSPPIRIISPPTSSL